MSGITLYLSEIEVDSAQPHGAARGRMRWREAVTRNTRALACLLPGRCSCAAAGQANFGSTAGDRPAFSNRLTRPVVQTALSIGEGCNAAIEIGTGAIRRPQALLSKAKCRS
jgi:hypothetical protein